MNKKVKSIAEATKGKISSIEERLSGVLRPVKPRKEFVHGVAQHIQTGNRMTFLVDRLQKVHIIAILIAGVVSVAVFVAIVWRALGSLFGKKHLV